MLVSRLGLVSSCLCRINRPTYLLSQRGAKQVTQDTKKDQDKDDDDAPIPLSQTDAAKWKAIDNRIPPRRPHVWWTGHAVYASITVFLVYFCILREENDIDELIYRPLPETIEGIDKAFPQIDFYTKPDYVRYHEEHNKDKKMRKEVEIEVNQRLQN